MSNVYHFYTNFLLFSDKMPLTVSFWAKIFLWQTLDINLKLVMINFVKRLQDKNFKLAKLKRSGLK